MIFIHRDLFAQQHKDYVQWPKWQQDVTHHVALCFLFARFVHNNAKVIFEYFNKCYSAVTRMNCYYFNQYRIEIATRPGEELFQQEIREVTVCLSQHGQKHKTWSSDVYAPH